VGQELRGDILDCRGDWPSARQAYSAVVALGPDSPAGYYSWGIALARHFRKKWVVHHTNEARANLGGAVERSRARVVRQLIDFEGRSAGRSAVDARVHDFA
jgi:hypothetical protein